jgi:hypothetical protein
MTIAECFSSDYQQARLKFRAAAQTAGGVLREMINPNLGPLGGRLFTDSAWFGPANAASVLVLISGTHGVEGFCGSGAQINWMKSGDAAALPRDMAVLLIHAINPFGFAWLRRVTEENVDLNRNWVDFDKPVPQNLGYQQIRDALCPSDWSVDGQASANQRLGAAIGQFGQPGFVAAATGGQYSDPDGVFYGGAAPTWARQTQTQIFEHYLGHAREVAIIDFHTGLGPYGYGEQIAPTRRGEPAFLRARSWYGAAVTSVAEGDSASPILEGDGMSAAIRLLPKATVTPLALEFGTVPGRQVLEALRADNWLHRWGDLQAPDAAPIKAAIRQAFYVDTDDWRGMVAGQSMMACRQAIAGLKISSS